MPAPVAASGPGSRDRTAIEWYDFFLYRHHHRLVFARTLFSRGRSVCRWLEAFACTPWSLLHDPDGAAVSATTATVSPKGRLDRALLPWGLRRSWCSSSLAMKNTSEFGERSFSASLGFVQGIGVGGDGAARAASMGWDARPHRPHRFLAQFRVDRPACSCESGDPRCKAVSGRPIFDLGLAASLPV